MLAKLGKVEGIDLPLLYASLFQFLQSDDTVERASLNKILFDFFHSNQEGIWIWRVNLNIY